MKEIQKIKVCIIDDEPDIRNVLSEAINDSYEMEVVCQADSVESSVEVIQRHNPDLIFLDIKIIGGDAFTILEILRRKKHMLPCIVINTGYNNFEYAQKIFNHYKDEVIMILQKPFWENWKDREKEIINRYREKTSGTESTFTDDKIIIKSNHNTYIFRFDNVQFLEVSFEKKGKGRTLIISKSETIEVAKTLTYIEERLPSNFIRISRYLIVNANMISRFDHSDQTLFLYGVKREFGVGNSYKTKLIDFLNL